MNLKELLNFVESQWHEAFLRFIDTGEAEEAFLSYLDRDAKCQEAVERAFTAQAKAFEELAQALITKPAEQPSKIQEEEPVEAILVACESLLALPPEQRRNAASKAASRLKVSKSPTQRQALKSMAEEFARV